MNTLIISFFAIYAFAITAEALYSHIKGLHLYDGRDTAVNICMGTMGVLVRAVTKGAGLMFWYWLYQFSVFKFSDSVLVWIILFLLNEFVYYWFHRISHEKRIFWAVHVNHHSSEKMNFSTATRTPFFNALHHNVFWAPLPLLGFDPAMIFSVELVGFLFAFFQHTQLVGKIKYIDWIINTPSHHRVHHASNPEYLNKNYGNVLIIFDRMFGTFKEETLKPVYGITKNIKTYNVIKVIFHEWLDMAHEKKYYLKSLLWRKQRNKIQL